MKRVAAVIQIWAMLLVACAALVAFSFVHIDVPTAHRFWNASRHFSTWGEAFGSSVILTAESAVLLFLVLMRLVRGHISAFGETLAIACLASMCAYVINDQVVKVIFGVPTPVQVIHGARHGFNFWLGSEGSSFPSGHMALAGAFAGVFMRFYRACIWPLSVLLLLAAGLLLVGDWHFLSDIIAGVFLGLSAGLLAGEGWAVHSER